MKRYQLLTAMCPHVKRSLVVGHPLFCKRLVEEKTAADKTAQPLKECQGRIPKTDLGLGSVWALKRWCSPSPHKAEKDLANYLANYLVLSNHRMKMLNIVKQIKTFQLDFFWHIHIFLFNSIKGQVEQRITAIESCFAAGLGCTIGGKLLFQSSLIIYDHPHPYPSLIRHPVTLHRERAQHAEAEM